MEEKLVFTFQGRQKSEERNAILLTFMICSVKQASAASINRQSFTIIHYLFIYLFHVEDIRKAQKTHWAL